MNNPTDKQVEAAARAIALIDWQPQMIDKVWINYINVARAAIIAADQAAWEPIENAPPGDDIDLIGLFQTPTRRLVSVCWRYKGGWWWNYENSVHECDW